MIQTSPEQQKWENVTFKVGNIFDSSKMFSKI